MPWSRTRLAETSSWVESGFEAHNTTSAPPSRRQIARFAVSAVTCRQAEMRMPFNGWFLMNSLRIICSTFMDWFAHSMRFLPSSASSTLLISLLICVAAVDIRLLWRLLTEIYCLPGYGDWFEFRKYFFRIHDPRVRSSSQNTLKGMGLSDHQNRCTFVSPVLPCVPL